MIKKNIEYQKLFEEKRYSELIFLIETSKNEKDLSAGELNLLGVTKLLVDKNKETIISSMARTTGYTATAAVNLFLDGLFNEKGVFPPELVGKVSGCYDYFMNYLKERNINYKRTVNKLN